MLSGFALSPSGTAPESVKVAAGGAQTQTPPAGSLGALKGVVPGHADLPPGFHGQFPVAPRRREVGVAESPVQKSAARGQRAAADGAAGQPRPTSLGRVFATRTSASSAEKGTPISTRGGGVGRRTKPREGPGAGERLARCSLPSSPFSHLENARVLRTSEWCLQQTNPQI